MEQQDLHQKLITGLLRWSQSFHSGTRGSREGDDTGKELISRKRTGMEEPGEGAAGKGMMPEVSSSFSPRHSQAVRK